MMIFPLSWPGKIVLVLVAVILGMIYWALASPDSFKRIILRKKPPEVAEATNKEA